MKTIVVATDFSASAGLAANFAAQLANDLKAGLVLVHAYQTWPDNPAKTGDFPLSETAARENSEVALQKMAHGLSTTLGAYTPIRCVAQEGHAMAVIQEVVQAEKTDLLVMATVGTAPQSTGLMGSLATDMVSETTVPLLLIPPGANYAGLKNALLAIDLAAPPDAVALATALTFARLFGSTLNVLCVSDKPDDPATRQRADHIRELLGQHPHTMTVKAKADEFYDTLLAFAHHTQSDLIMMLPQTRNWFMSLWTEGETQRMARLTDIPLLTIS